ncbi:MAG TPA: hypothetical protein VFM14_18340 [Gemmatimonadales bacterium]|nr:hypothetical protein [Gemmatimonadales bacterium]
MSRARVLHRSLVAGVALLLVVFVLLKYRGLVPFLTLEAGRTLIAFVLAGAGLASVLVGLLIMSPRVPRRPVGQTEQIYLDRDDVIARALLVWALCESGGGIAAVGFALTGAMPPLVVSVAALLALTSYGPGYFSERVLSNPRL